MMFTIKKTVVYCAGEIPKLTKTVDLTLFGGTVFDKENFVEIQIKPFWRD